LFSVNRRDGVAGLLHAAAPIQINHLSFVLCVLIQDPRTLKKPALS